MPSRTLPTLPQSDVSSHNTAKSCYVTLGTKVYDVTSFLPDHPGGGDLILEYGGKDVSAIMQDELSHSHSEAAYEILDESLVGFVATEAVVKTVVDSDRPGEVVPLPPTTEEGRRELAEHGADNAGNLEPRTRTENEGEKVFAATGMSSAEDLSVETDARTDYKVHKFLDLDKPLFPQVWFGGFSKDFYLEQVHRPRHYKGGESAPLFGNFLEPLSKTAWWVVPMVWMPPVIYGTVYAGRGLSSILELAAYWALGTCIWTFLEYGLHRCLFHVDKYVNPLPSAPLSSPSPLSIQTNAATNRRYLPDNRVGITTHFLLHGIHHYLPMDRYRLVMPPTLFIVLATPFWRLAHFVFAYNRYAATAVYCGGIFGYICYDLTHYFLHHRK